MQNVALLTRDSAPNVALLDRTPAAVAPAITTTALPGGIVGTPYNQVIQVSGTEPITAAMLSGALPAGLSLAGATRTISGTPTTPVAASFTVRATNSAGSADKALSILVPNEGVGGAAPTVTTVTLVPIAASVAAGSTVDLVVTVEDQDGQPIPNITGLVESLPPGNATGEWLAPTDANGQATIRVSALLAGSAQVRAVVDGLRSNATAVTVTASAVIECKRAEIELAVFPVSIGIGTVINCARADIEIAAYPVTIEERSTVECKRAEIELAAFPVQIESGLTAPPSAVRMLILKPDWIEGSGFAMIRGVPTFVKSDDELLDYSINWSGILGPGETVIGHRWNVPAGLAAGAAVRLGNITTQWLGGGDIGQSYDVDCIATMSTGRVYERSFRIMVVER